MLMVLLCYLYFSEHSKTQLIKLQNKLVKAEVLQAVNMTLCVPGEGTVLFL